MSSQRQAGKCQYHVKKVFHPFSWVVQDTEQGLFSLGLDTKSRLLLLTPRHRDNSKTNGRCACQQLLGRCEEGMAQAWREMSKQPPTAFSVAWQRNRKEAGDCRPLWAWKQQWVTSGSELRRPIPFLKPACSKGLKLLS